MRIATWNVNSLKARLEKVRWWIDRAAPDVLLLQETKLPDTEAPSAVFEELGYELAHHGEGGRNGVAIASRRGITDVVTNFGLPRERAPDSRRADEDPFSEARMVAAMCGGIHVVSIYVPNGRTLDSVHYRAKLRWFDQLSSWLSTSCSPTEPLVVGGDYNVAPDDRDVFNAAACHGGTHVSPPEREAFARLCTWGLVDGYRKHHEELERYTWWDYRAGDFYKNYGMRIDHLLVTQPVAARSVGAEIDREARKGKPIPSDHAPLTLDLDEAGRPFDAGWEGAAERIAARRASRGKKSS
jgi:exodeoxyribonuclease-3